jgi:hypothetical protein
MNRKLYLFIGADRTKNAGYADYLKAIALALPAQAPPAIACRLGAPSEAFSTKLPIDNREYDALPVFTQEYLAQLKAEQVEIVGLGDTTLASVIEAQDYLRRRGINVSSSYVNHMVSDEDLLKIIEHDIRAFAPIANDHVTQIAAVPHTNTLRACRIECDNFIKTPNGCSVANWMDNKEPFAIAVLNAGFAVNGVHEPYTALEAYRDGKALGQNLASHTHLILAQGGPRSLQDEVAGEATMDAFKKGYLEAQEQSGGSPKVICERFAPDLNYNIIKAGYMLAQSTLCQAFISNAEGYGTMDGAVNLVPQHVMLGMFPFAAEEKDPTGQRRDNTRKYNRKGIQWLCGDPAKPFIVSAYKRIAPLTLAQNEESTLWILSLLGLSGSKQPAPRLSH